MQILCGTTSPERMRRNLEVVAEWESNEAMRRELQPFVEAVKELLQELGRTTP